MFEKKNQIKIEKNEMKAKKFDSKKYIGILCKHGMNGGDSSQEICLKALIIDYWKTSRMYTYYVHRTLGDIQFRNRQCQIDDALCGERLSYQCVFFIRFDGLLWFRSMI